MKRELAEQTLAIVESHKVEVENIIKEHLGVQTNLRFELLRGQYIIGVDALSDTYEQMTATPLLRQLFKMAELRIDVFRDENDPDWICFAVGISYQHNYRGGSNGHDLMGIHLNLAGEEPIIRK